MCAALKMLIIPRRNGGFPAHFGLKKMLLLHEEREFVEIGVRHAPDGVSFSTHISKRMKTNLCLQL